MAEFRSSRKLAMRIRQLGSPEAINKVGDALFAGGSLIATDAAVSITTGAVSGKHRVPSKPGEPPNADTHVLDTSIETARTGPLRVEVSANAPYAKALEYGTARMAARPFMSPALHRNREAVRDLVRRAINKVLRETDR